MGKLNNTWKKIKEAAGQDKELDDELMFRQLGIDGEY